MKRSPHWSFKDSALLNFQLMQLYTQHRSRCNSTKLCLQTYALGGDAIRSRYLIRLQNPFDGGLLDLFIRTLMICRCVTMYMCMQTGHYIVYPECIFSKQYIRSKQITWRRPCRFPDRRQTQRIRRWGTKKCSHRTPGDRCTRAGRWATGAWESSEIVNNIRFWLQYKICSILSIRKCLGVFKHQFLFHTWKLFRIALYYMWLPIAEQCFRARSLRSSTRVMQSQRPKPIVLFSFVRRASKGHEGSRWKHSTI